MRKELRNLVDGEYWVYGPAVHEFHLVINLIQKYSDYADESVSRNVAELYQDPEHEDAANEVSSDLAYYNHIEKGLLWSFALWRIQGMFEALLINGFLPKKPTKSLVGFKSKVHAIAEAGYMLPEELLSELSQWATLRNLLSHAPPEHFRPIAVDRQDVEEYVQLLETVCALLEQQKPSICV